MASQLQISLHRLVRLLIHMCWNLRPLLLIVLTHMNWPLSEILMKVCLWSRFRRFWDLYRYITLALGMCISIQSPHMSEDFLWWCIPFTQLEIHHNIHKVIKILILYGLLFETLHCYKLTRSHQMSTEVT